MAYGCDYVYLFVGQEPKYSTSRIMQIRKSIREKKFQCAGIKKPLFVCEIWSEGSYVGTLSDYTTFDVIRNYFENQGNRKNEQYKQMKIFDPE